MSDTKYPPDFSWITTAPIQVLRPQDVHPRLEAFRANITSWFGEKKADAAWAADPNATKDWNAKSGHAGNDLVALR